MEKEYRANVEVYHLEGWDDARVQRELDRIDTGEEQMERKRKAEEEKAARKRKAAMVVEQMGVARRPQDEKKEARAKAKKDLEEAEEEAMRQTVHEKPCIECKLNDRPLDQLLCDNPVDGGYCNNACHITCAGLERRPVGDVSLLVCRSCLLR